MTQDELLDAWTLDSAIDDNHLDTASIKSTLLHAKYLRLLTEHKMKLAALQNQYNTLRQDKFRYYRGEMSREELQKRNWSPWQYNKPLRAEMDEHLLGDADLNRVKVKIEYVKVMVEAIDSIMKAIINQQWIIRNAIEFRKFQAGV